MNVMKIVESVLTYFLTAGFVAIVTYFFRISKRITILEEHGIEMQLLRYLKYF